MRKRIGSKDSNRGPSSARIRLSAPEAEGKSRQEAEASTSKVITPDVSPEQIDNSSDDEEIKDLAEKQLEDKTLKKEVIEETTTDAENTPAVVSHQMNSYLSGNWLTRAASSATGWVLKMLGLRDNDPRWHIIVDTNMVLQTLMDLHSVRAQLLNLAGQDMMLVLPRVMLQELEHIKDGDRIEHDLQARARETWRILEMWEEAGWALSQDVQDMEESLRVFKSFTWDNNDDKIIHTALQYKYSYGKKNVGVFTMDRGMRATARPMKFRTFCIRAPDEEKLLSAQKAARAAAKRKRAKVALQSVSKVLANRSATTAAAPSQMKPHHAKREEEIQEFFKAMFDRVIVIRDHVKKTLSSNDTDVKMRALALQSLRLLHTYISTICTQFSSALTSARTGKAFDPSASLYETLSSFVIDYNVEVGVMECGLLDRLLCDSKMSNMADGGLSEMREILKTVDDLKRFLSSDELF